MFKHQLDLCIDIAEEHAARAAELSAKARKPRGDGGYVVTPDPDQRSYRDSLIAVAFACAYLEGIMYLHLVHWFGVRRSSKYDRLPYKKRAKQLGVKDRQLLKELDYLSDVRKHVIHIAPGSPRRRRMYIAQKEAPIQVDVVKRCTAHLKTLPKPQDALKNRRHLRGRRYI
jgi:hypothetical protein